jgi:hypothetical protein
MISPAIMKIFRRKKINFAGPFHCIGLRKLNNLWSIDTLGLETSLLAPNQMVAFSPEEASHYAPLAQACPLSELTERIPFAES